MRNGARNRARSWWCGGRGTRMPSGVWQIYSPYVRDTVISLEEDPPSLTEMQERLARSLETHDWLVLEGPHGVVGFAYGSQYRSRAAYRWACEVSVYVEAGHQRAGAGRLLYEELFASLVDRGYLTALAGMTLPNAASEGLHRALGFEPVGHLAADRLEVRRLARRALDAAAPRAAHRAAGGARLGLCSGDCRCARRPPW